MRPQSIKLNLVPGGVIPVINVSQYDVGRPLEFVLWDGKSPATIEENTVIDIRATKPDGHGFQYACTWENNVVSVATQIQMTVLSGSIECELHLEKNSTVIGTANFILEVEQAALRSDTDISETELPAIIDMARGNQEAAAASAAAAAESESNAADSAAAAATSESNAADSASAAATSESNAADSASAAATSESNAASSETEAATSATAAAGSATAAATSKSDAEAYAVGKRNGVDVPSSDVTYNNNAKHYAEVAAQAAAGGLIPQGTTTFSQLPPLADTRVGYMWNISDDFTTTADFREGAGIRYGAGSNVYKTGDGKWDVTSGQMIMMQGATGNAAGTPGAVAGPTAGQQNYVWFGDAQWHPLSYVGMIIHSTTLDTMQKVIDFYGGTTWIQHSGYFLRGASSGVTANSAVKDGGQDSVTPSGTNTSGAVQSHTLTVNEIPSHSHGLPLKSGGSLGTGDNNDGAARMRNAPNTDANTFGVGNKGGSQGHTHEFTQPTFTGTSHTNLPSYKNVYIWERTV